MSAKRNKFQVIILILSLLISPFFYNINEFTPKEWDIALFAFSISNLVIALITIVIYVISLILLKVGKIKNKNILNIQKLIYLICLTIFFIGAFIYGESYNKLGWLQIILLYVLLFIEEEIEEKIYKFKALKNMVLIPGILYIFSPLIGLWNVHNPICIISIVLLLLWGMFSVLIKRKVKEKYLFSIVFVIIAMINIYMYIRLGSPI